jgi:hypothetical protein
MPKRSSKGQNRKRRTAEDLNQAAARIIAIATGKPVPAKNPAAVALGRLGGLKGGKVRAAKLSPERRQQIAAAAARKRWEKKHQP